MFTLSAFLDVFVLASPGLHLHGAGMVSLALSVPVGLLAGILINYFADVLPATRHLTRPVCPSCGRAFALKDYLLIGRCSHCSTKRPARRWIVLSVAVILSGLMAIFPLPRLGYWGSLPLAIYLGVVAVIDIEHHLVLVETSLFGLVLCFIYGVIMRGWLPTLRGGLGGLAVMLVLFFTGILFSKIVGTLRGRNVSQVAFGFGDVFAGAFLGLLTGWPLIAGAIAVGMLVFAAYSLVYIAVLLVTKRYSAFASALPLAPFLILGAVVMLYL